MSVRLSFDDPVAFIKGATPLVQRCWAVLGIRTVENLLLTPPRRYEDYSRIVQVRDALAGETVTLRVRIIRVPNQTLFEAKKMSRFVARDASGTIGLTFFHQPWLREQLTLDKEIFCSGKIMLHPRFGRSLLNPLWEAAESDTLAAGKIAPVYALSGSLTQKRYRQLVQFVLDNVDLPPDPVAALPWVAPLPALSFDAAIRAVHAPQDAGQAEAGRQRFAFDELLAWRLAMRQVRQGVDAAGAPRIAFDEAFAKRFVAALPFPLTGDQKRAMWISVQDMVQSVPMRRLLLGDVGSGKTLVAAFLAAQVQRSGASAVMLAPTDILARQHAQSMRRVFAAHHIPIILITRTDRRVLFDREETVLKKESAVQEYVQRGQAVFLGTHALLYQARLPADLALAIVDEQHRFGVGQRELLTMAVRADGRVPHFLSMTATPIPRSLALTLYGDLSVSRLKEKPAGRQPIATRVCAGAERERAYEAIRLAVSREERAFVVCPLIDPSDTLGVRSATEEWQRLAHGPLSGLSVGLLHGRLKTTEKDQVMADFVSGRISVLVATAVIEVGVDVPEATVIAIEGAERFGLAQLHQLRGRVGRSHRPSQCFLLTDAQGESRERLELLVKTQDGFRLAEEDLGRRGGGNMLGTAQSGYGQMFLSARLSDLDLMQNADQLAANMLSVEPLLDAQPYWKEKVARLRKSDHLE